MFVIERKPVKRIAQITPKLVQLGADVMTDIVVVETNMNNNYRNIVKRDFSERSESHVTGEGGGYLSGKPPIPVFM